MERYDFAIIGAGSTGLIAADFAVRLGARVALLERDRIGGDCTWTGCVPSKSLIKVARIAHDLRSASVYGIQSEEPLVNMAAVRDYVQSTVQQIYRGTTPEALQSKGMDVRLGPVSFVDARTLAVGEDRISARKILIATGAHPADPAIPGLSQTRFFTYRDIFDRDTLPRSMVIIGGGPVGVETAQAFQRLGCRITMFAEQILPKEDPEASRILSKVFEREGIHVIRERVVSVGSCARGVSVASANSVAEVDALFVAAGRTPTLNGLNLEAAGVRYSPLGIEVNERLQTSVRGIYAAGDVLGGQQFSHLAGWQGFQAARNALLPGGSAGFPRIVPRITFTDPEVAHVGLTEAEARAANPDCRVSAWPIQRVDRAVSEHDTDGMLKLIASKSGKILGATIVAERAGESIMEIVMAMRSKNTLSDVAGVIHPYPTYNSGIQLLATEMAMNKAFQGASGKLIRALSRAAR